MFHSKAHHLSLAVVILKLNTFMVQMVLFRDIQRNQVIQTITTEVMEVTKAALIKNQMIRTSILRMGGLKVAPYFTDDDITTSKILSPLNYLPST